jgi:CheY-like chemotaxis protein
MAARVVRGSPLWRTGGAWRFSLRMAQPDAMPGRVLIVDDEEDVLQSTAMVVESLGYEVTTLADPAEILEIVHREMPAVILQDLHMPGFNLAGLVASLRSDPATATVPLVFFSANSDVAATAARYDAWGYLSKPFTAHELAGVLAKVTGDPPGPRREPEREVRAVFHDYWNLLAALANYSGILDGMEGLPPQARLAIGGLHDTILKMESKTDRLRTYAMSWAGAGPARQPGASAGDPGSPADKPKAVR